jgi:hypothetical protein
MGKYSEESHLVNLPKTRCEERLLAFDKDKFELKNHVLQTAASQIVLHSKIVFTNNGQRITIGLNVIDEQHTEITIRSELISNLLQNDRGMNKKNINIVLALLDDKKNEEAPENSALSESVAKKKRAFFGKKLATDIQLSMMASYLGGYPGFEKPMKGTVEIHSAGIDFAVMGPKFTITSAEIKKITIASDAEILKNPEWCRFYLKRTVDKAKNEQERTKKDKLVFDYFNGIERAYCIFRGDNQYELEKNLHKAKDYIESMIKK